MSEQEGVTMWGVKGRHFIDYRLAIRLGLVTPREKRMLRRWEYYRYRCRPLRRRKGNGRMVKRRDK